jgi:uncharacterized protein YjbJ (UPF0337 family)
VEPQFSRPIVVFASDRSYRGNPGIGAVLQRLGDPPDSQAHRHCLQWLHGSTHSETADAHQLIGVTAHRNTEGVTMNWDRIEGNWKQAKGKMKEQWGKLTDDDFDVVAGKRDQLAGKIQERYGVAKDEAERQVSAWEGTVRDDWFDPPSDRPLR